MYDITYKGRTLRLNNRDYKQLERRFDPSRYKTKEIGFQADNVRCICGHYKCECNRCPFQKQLNTSCTDVFRDVSGYRVGHTTLASNAVVLYIDNLDGIKKVHDVLLTATKVSAH